MNFRIPGPPNRRQTTLPPDVLQLAYQANTVLFPRDSTFWTFGRECVHGFALKDQQAFVNVERLLKSYATGPLMSLYAAELLRHLTPRVSQVIAREGLNRLARHRFVDDCRQLLNRNDIVNDVIEDCLATLRDMEDEQLNTLLAPIVGPERRTVMIGALRDDGSSDDDMVFLLLGEFWDAGLQELVRGRLETLRGGPEIRNANREQVPDATIRTTALAP